MYDRNCLLLSANKILPYMRFCLSIIEPLPSCESKKQRKRIESTTLRLFTSLFAFSCYLLWHFASSLLQSFASLPSQLHSKTVKLQSWKGKVAQLKGAKEKDWSYNCFDVSNFCFINSAISCSFTFAFSFLHLCKALLLFDFETLLFQSNKAKEDAKLKMWRC